MLNVRTMKMRPNYQITIYLKSWKSIPWGLCLIIKETVGQIHLYLQLYRLKLNIEILHWEFDKQVAKTPHGADPP